jgi:hypothetical protein
MDYELAKRLEAAGYPYNWHFHELDEGNTCTNYPTLSELIESCGDKFDKLEREYCLSFEDEINDDINNNIPVNWKAFPTQEAWEETDDYKEYPCVMDCCGYQSGDNPSEAVANLWLALNTKQHITNDPNTNPL